MQAVRSRRSVKTDSFPDHKESATSTNEVPGSSTVWI